MQYGAQIRTPGMTKIGSNDPAQQALLDAMQQNGAPTTQQSIDRLPNFQTATGPARTTQPVSVGQPTAPTGGINTGGGLTPAQINPPGSSGMTPPSSLGSQGSGLQLQGMTGNPNQAPSSAWAQLFGSSAIPLDNSLSDNNPALKNPLPNTLSQPGVSGPKNLSGQAGLDMLAPPTTGGVSSQYPGVSPAQLSSAYNAQAMSSPAAQAQAAGPQSPQGMGQYASSLEGFDSGKLNDPNKHDPKYDFARIASNYPPTPAGLQQAMAQIKQAYPNAQQIGNDKVDFGDGYGPVDVIRAAGDGGKAWQFQGQDASGATGATAAPSGGDPIHQLSQLQAGAQQGDSYSQMVLQYLMQQLGLDGAMMQNSR
jgi:hypothetical protein